MDNIKKILGVTDKLKDELLISILSLNEEQLKKLSSKVKEALANAESSGDICDLVIAQFTACALSQIVEKMGWTAPDHSMYYLYKF